MKTVDKILNSTKTASEQIFELKQKELRLPSWAKVLLDYEPTLHTIVRDRTGRKDKVHDGRIERASRIHIGLEKLVTKRATEFTFAIPVRRNYVNATSDEQTQEIISAIEKIYKHARIDSENIKRGTSFYASCEMCTVWYTTESSNTLYGFDSQYKLKCQSYSPMDGVKIYPLFNEVDDLIAISLEYQRLVLNDRVTFFETYTKDRHLRWRYTAGSPQQDVDEKIALGKIPVIYAYRREPIFYGLSHLRQEIEYTLSRNSDVVAYNSAPILKVSGAVGGAEQKGESRRVVRVENGGDVSYVSWAQSNEAVRYHVDTLMSLFFKLSQMPDISFEKMSSLGQIGYDARKTLFTDAHLKIGEESGILCEFLDREVNVVKAFLKLMRPEWSEVLDNLEVENIITPYVQDDEAQTINRLQSANGGKPIISQLESIRMFGKSNDPLATMAQINEENRNSQTNDIMGGYQ